MLKLLNTIYVFALFDDFFRVETRSKDTSTSFVFKFNHF